MAWIFTQHGFVSVVEFNHKKDVNKTLAETDFTEEHDLMVCRARVRDDLDQIASVMKSLGLKPVIREMRSADYSWRMLCPRTAVQAWMWDAVAKIDYDSHFKEAAQEHSHGAKDRYSAMMGVWSAMARLQQTTPYAGTPRGDHPEVKKPTFSHSATGDPWTKKPSQGIQVPGNASLPPSVPLQEIATEAQADANQEWLDSLETLTPAEPESEQISFDMLRDMLLEVAANEISQEVCGQMSEEAFELYCAADDLPGSEGHIMSKDQIDTLAETVLTKIAAYEAAESEEPPPAA